MSDHDLERSRAASARAACPRRKSTSVALRRFLGRLAPIMTTIIAFLMGGLVVLFTGKNPLKVYHAVFNGTGINWFFHVGNYQPGSRSRRTTCGSRGTRARSLRGTCSRRCF